MADAQVFADGEPVDPQKLRYLQNQINEVRATAGNAYNLISTTINGNLVNRTYHHRSGTVTFKNLASGKNSTPASCGFTWDSSKYEDPVTVVTPVKDDLGSGNDQWIFAVIGDYEPKVVVYYKDGASKPLAYPGPLKVNWISSAAYKVE